MSFPSQLVFQEPTSHLIETMDYFHDVALISTTIVILSLVSSTALLMSSSSPSSSHVDHNYVETLWTIWPSFILISLGLPSLAILYSIDEAYLPSISVSVIGHQWYWSYSVPEVSPSSWDSYIVSSPTRLLEVDNRLLLPFSVPIRLLVSSTDVLHAWSLSSSSLKVDATPGRISLLNATFLNPSIIYGQCSELCGSNHSFMPIVLETFSPYRGIGPVPTATFPSLVLVGLTLIFNLLPSPLTTIPATSTIPRPFPPGPVQLQP